MVWELRGVYRCCQFEGDDRNFRATSGRVLGDVPTILVGFIAVTETRKVSELQRPLVLAFFTLAPESDPTRLPVASLNN